jgi:glycosyltransferase involved in cell wall biosynthesis
MKQRGWQPEVFALNLGGPLTSCLEAAGVPIWGFKPSSWLQHNNDRIKARISLLLTTATLVKVLLVRRPAAIHFFLPAAYLIGGIAAFLVHARPRIMSRRSLRNYQLAHPVYARIEQLLHPLMDRVCGNSRAVIEQLQEEGIPQRRLRLIYNGIDLQPFNMPFDRIAQRATADIAPDTFVIAMVANLIPYKGHVDLIYALANVHMELPVPWLLLCIGRDDGIGNDLERLAETLGISCNIRWMGAQTDVPRLLRLADVGVLCSHQEGFSNAVLEGMAACLPMVVTDVGGNAEAVVDGESGYVVPARQPQTLGEAILRVASNPKRQAMGRSGRTRVEQNFSLTACVDAYEALYREVGVA